jgi:hypothetical protein
VSYTFLLDAGEESSAESFSDIPAFVLLRLNLTAEKSFSNDSGMASCQSSQSGMMCEHLMENHGEEKLMSCAEGSRAKTLASPPTREQELPASEAGCGVKCSEWFAKLDLDSHLWKTPQLCLFVESKPCLVIWPKWGMMLGGECFPLPTLEHDTSVKGYGLRHPTPTKRDYKGASDGQQEDFSRWTTWLHREFFHSTKSSYPHPNCSEMVMGFPIMWTALKPLGMDKFQQWLDLHGKPFHNKTPMTPDETRRKVELLDELISKPREDPNQLAVTLFQIWHDSLWEVCSESFAELLESEFEMTEADAWATMKAAVATGLFPKYETEKIDEQFDKLT